MNREFEYKTIFYALKAEDASDDGRNFKAVLSTYKNEDYVGDIIEPGAFDDFVASEDSMVMLREHNIKDIIGEWSNLKVVGNQLRAAGEILPKGEIQIADETAVLIKRKLIKGVSISFRYAESEYTRRDLDEEDAPYYSFRFTKVFPKEASIVLYPANDKAGLKATDIERANKARWNRLNSDKLFSDDEGYNIRAIERILTENGLTRTQSKNLMSVLRDSADDEPQIDMSDSIDMYSKWADEVLNN